MAQSVVKMQSKSRDAVIDDMTVATIRLKLKRQCLKNMCNSYPRYDKAIYAKEFICGRQLFL